MSVGKDALTTVKDAAVNLGEKIISLGVDYQQSAGLMEKACENMNGTFAGNSANIQESLQGLGLGIYQEYESTLAGISGLVSSSMDQLMNEFSKGGMKGMVDSA